jgi:aspartyl protease family protein
MDMRWQLGAVLGLWVGIAPSFAFAVDTIEVQALMSDAALLRIGDKQRMLRNGQHSPEGVLLVSADTRRAIIEVDGHRKELKLSQRIGGNFKAADTTEVRIERNAHAQYLTTAQINGRLTTVIVDTGASTVALSGTQAALLGIDYHRIGTPGHATTASGVVNAYSIQLDNVAVGGIAVPYVPAMVIEGDFPVVALLGMTFLQRVGMREENGALFLKQKF